MSFSIIPYQPEHRSQVVATWELSVRATHHFLAPEDIDFYKSIVAGIDFSSFPVCCCMAGDGTIAGFAGTAGNKLEMLFIHPGFAGKGMGTALLQYAIRELGITEVDVNEDNVPALGFYKANGFEVYTRQPLDDSGKPYPILKMKLSP